jgi:ankyrin repeat protein
MPNETHQLIESITSESDEAAIKEAKEKMITLLFEGADLSEENESGQTPMMLAAIMPNRNELLKLMLEKTLTPPTPDEKPFVMTALNTAEANKNEVGIETLKAKLGI